MQPTKDTPKAYLLSLKKVFLILFLTLFGLFSFLTFSRLQDSSTPGLKQNVKSITINNKTVFVNLAQSPEEKAQGLSGKKSLKSNEGMLFVFDNKTYPAFWMKDMHFAIDIIWISDGQIVSINENVAPEPGKPLTKLSLYRPPVGIDYVLETKAGFCKENAIQVGNSIDLSAI